MTDDDQEPVVYILDGVHERITCQIGETSGITVGFLVGQKTETQLNIIGAIGVEDSRPDVFAFEFQKTSWMLPAGCCLCGIFMKTDHAAKSPAILEKLAEKIIPDTLKSQFGCESVLLLPQEVDHKECDLYRYTFTTGKVTKVQAKTRSEEDIGENVILRVQASFPLSFELEKSRKKLLENITKEIYYLKTQVLSTQTVYHVENSSVLLSTENSVVSSVSEDTLCEELSSFITSDDEAVTGKKQKKKHVGPEEDMIHVKLLSNLSAENVAGRLNCSPILHHEHDEYQTVSMTLSVDVLCVVAGSTPVKNLPHLLSQGICKQLDQMQYCIFKNDKVSMFHTPVSFHYKPPGFYHYVTLTYPHGVTEEDLESVRKKKHQCLLLPGDRPLLRRANRHLFPEDLKQEVYLVNPHAGLPPSGVKDGVVSVVTGLYSYHHYMQDRMDDNHWGCAYRSLQTLCSWFRYQGYVNKPIPTHKDIQQALVDIGDKEAKFVGSKQWIGSTEVSFVLDHLYGVTSKILFVSTGAELSSKGSELARHFETQGTPIMIGGGVLAHTILGIDFNQMTGDIKFLILDPHYTGAEDLKVIHDKGWCGWKGPNFWDQQAYYNLCMPQRPAVI